MKDIAFGPENLDELWLQDFPNAKVMRIENAGHYIQKDAHYLQTKEDIAYSREACCEEDAKAP